MAGELDRVSLAREHSRLIREVYGEVKRLTSELWGLLRDFHANEEWRDLGYRTFGLYVEHELGVSQRRIYQLIDAAGVKDSLVADAHDPAIINPPHNLEKITESQARVLKPLSPPERRKVVEGVDFAKLSVAELKKLALERTHRAQIERFETVPQPTQALALLDTPVIRVETHRRLEAPQPTVVRYGRPVVTLDTTLGELDALLVDRQRFDTDLDDYTRSRLATYFAFE